MNKKEVQKRVLRGGEPIALDDFTWCERTKTFTSWVDWLVFAFEDINGCTFNTGWGCTFNTNWDCTFNTGYDCTFNTNSGCSFNTDIDCTFNTGHRCTFKTDSNCTFNTLHDCTFKTGSGCVIVRRDILEIIQPNEGDLIHLCPYRIEGHLVNGELNGEPHIIADGILSKIIRHKGDVYKVVNHGEKTQSYLVTDGVNYAHGKTLKEARDSLVYKISDRDKSAYKGKTPGDVMSKAEIIKMYRVVTGACEGGVRAFVEAQDSEKEKYKVSEIIELTKGQYGHEEFKKFIGV